MEKNQKQIYRVAVLFFVGLLFCTACNGRKDANGSTERTSMIERVEGNDAVQVQAVTMKLVKTEGAVGVADDAGAEVPLVNEMGLYSGYGVDTETESYAWINLDDVKLTKMDADSEISILKKDKALEILVENGSLFFYVKEPLAADESFGIHTSDTIVGIRETCGWVTVDEWNHLKLYLLDGKTEYIFRNPDTGKEESVMVSAGEKISLIRNDDGNFAIEVDDLTPDDIPVFVANESDNDIVRQWMETSDLTQDSLEESNQTETTEEADASVTEQETLTTAPVFDTYDLKDYSDTLPEEFGGNLSATLAALLYPDNPVFSYDDGWAAYTLGDGGMRIGASANNDGYLVWVLRDIDGFSVYGVKVGMTEEAAVAVLEKQGIVNSDGYYMITDRKYLTLNITDGIISGITFAHQIRSSNTIY